MKNAFLKIAGLNELASFFGISYSELSGLIYDTHDSQKYMQFKIPKKNGGYRKISSPCDDLKVIHLFLKDVFYELYTTKPAVHGFAKNKSIVTNAESHLGKNFIFNIDLSDFFGSIHFGRIRNLFKSEPFNFNHTVSTVLAQICCFNNSLPQGAPTSPILSNMIARKLDTQLQHLAKITNCTYTRYADDISFSFTSSRHKLPKKIVVFSDEGIRPGPVLTHIIESNGFNINYGKVRLCSTLSRMEVTGLTVNDFPNVRRQYIRQLSSMLHAWREYGLSLAASESSSKYKNYRAGRYYVAVLRGKLDFLQSVRGYQDPIFLKLAKQFNDLVAKERELNRLTSSRCLRDIRIKNSK